MRTCDDDNYEREGGRNKERKLETGRIIYSFLFVSFIKLINPFPRFVLLSFIYAANHLRIERESHLCRLFIFLFILRRFVISHCRRDFWLRIQKLKLKLNSLSPYDRAWFVFFVLFDLYLEWEVKSRHIRMTTTSNDRHQKITIKTVDLLNSFVIGWDGWLVASRFLFSFV